MSQFTVPASAVTVKGNTITINNATITGFDGKNFIVALAEPAQVAVVPVPPPNTPARSRKAPAEAPKTAAPKAVAAPAKPKVVDLPDEAPKQARSRRSAVAAPAKPKVVDLPDDDEDSFDEEDIEVIG